MLQKFKSQFRSLYKYDSNIERYIFYGILFDIMLNLYKPFAVKFLERLGGNEGHISLYNALPGFIAIFVVFPSALFIRKVANKKKITSIFFFISRLFVLSFALIPFLPSGLRAITFVILFSLMNFPEAVSQSSLQSFIGDTFPANRRATAISLRNKFGILATIIITLVSGQILTRIPRTEDQRIITYQIFFVLAFIMGLFEIRCFSGFETKLSSEVKKLDIISTVKKIVNNKTFMGFFTCSIVFHFGWQMGWPLFSIYQLKVLGSDESWLATVAIASSISMFFSYGYWNKFINKYGSNTTNMFTIFGMAITPLLYIVSPTNFILTFTSLISGFFTAGSTTVLFTSLLEVTPEEDRVVYIGFYDTCKSVSLTIAPLVGHYILTNNNIYVALGATAFFRFLGCVAFGIRGFYLKNKIKTT